MLHQCHPAFHRQSANRRASKFSACPFPPAVPICPIIARITSLAVTPVGNCPSTRTRMFSFSSAPDTAWPVHAPEGSNTVYCQAANAPWVEYANHHRRSSSLVRSHLARGPIHMYDTLALIQHFEFDNARFFTVFRPASAPGYGNRVFNPGNPALRSVVGTLWSGVARLASTRQGLRLAIRSPSKACGRSYFVQQLAINVDQGTAIIALFHQVRPQFVVKGFAAHRILHQVLDYYAGKPTPL